MRRISFKHPDIFDTLVALSGMYGSGAFSEILW